MKWIPVPEFEEYYEVNEYGQVKALDRYVERVGKGNTLHIVHFKEKILQPTIDAGRILSRCIECRKEKKIMEITQISLLCV